MGQGIERELTEWGTEGTPLRAISRVMDLDTSGSAHAPEFSAATTAIFELAKPLDNVLRGLGARP